MRLFFLIFFGIYGGMHLYFFVRARSGLALPPAAAIGLALFLLAMTLAPLAVRFLERSDRDVAAQCVAWTGYGWMGFLFLFCSLGACLDLSRLLARSGALFLKYDLPSWAASGRVLFLVAAGGALAAAVYGWFEAGDIRDEHLTVVSPSIPAAAGRIRIAQISDLHLGLVNREWKLGRVVRLVREADPDLLVSTGDLVDGHLDGATAMSALLAEIRPRLGKFAVTGNHEYYVGLEQALRFTRAAGFTVLRGEAADAGGLITVAGVDDPTGRQSGQNREQSESTLLGGLSRDRFTLFLKHRPVASPESVGLFDLQLSGHIHKGQIFPFTVVTRLAYPVSTGLSRLAGRGWLYVSRGTGTWGPPIRFLAPPEVTIIDLVHGDR